MFRVVDCLRLGEIDCVSVEGEIGLLKNGLKLMDEKGNVFVVETVGMTHYQQVEDYQRKAELVLRGDVEHIGKCLCLRRVQ